MDSRYRDAQNVLSQYEWSRRIDAGMLDMMAMEFKAPIEVNRWDLYDRWRLVGNTERAIFFQHHMGTAVDMESDTNMEMAGYRPGNRISIVAGITFVVPKRMRDQWERVSHQASVQIRISGKTFAMIPASIIPCADINQPLHRKVTREWKVPGKAWRTVTEEGHSNGYGIDPVLVILPYRPFEVNVRFYPRTPDPMPMIPLMCVLAGWDIRSQL